MTEQERAESQARMLRIARENRAANRPGPNRTVPPKDRGEELADRLGFTIADGTGPVNWTALTRDG